MASMTRAMRRNMARRNGRYWQKKARAQKNAPSPLFQLKDYLVR